uniref:Ig-like domain-containing protein n=1 Tax=Oryctolagus cuniculus TaxID=9986 RepID=G1TWB8_RABIT
CRPSMDTKAPTQLLRLLLLWLRAVQLTPSPSSPSAPAGDTVTMCCKASGGVSGYISWSEQKPGKSPGLLIYRASTLPSGVPSRVRGSGSGTDDSLSISGAEDAATYFCQGYSSYPPTLLF